MSKARSVANKKVTATRRFTPRDWEKFVRRLVARSKKCDNTPREAEKILNEMGVSNVAGVLEYCSQNGGYCDCEILLNAAFSPPRNDDDLV